MLWRFGWGFVDALEFIVGRVLDVVVWVIAAPLVLLLGACRAAERLLISAVGKASVAQRSIWVRHRVAILLLVAAAIFAYFVWPTPYSYHAVGSRLVRVNRFTGAAEYVQVDWPRR